MDKKSLLAIAIITVIIILLPSYYKLINPQPEFSPTVNIQKDEQTKSAETRKDSVVGNIKSDNDIEQTKAPLQETVVDSFSGDFKERIVKIETPYIITEISNRGGGKILSWYLKKYDTWLKSPVKIIDPDINNGIDISFLTIDGERVNLENYLFFKQDTNRTSIVLEEDDELTLSFRLGFKSTVLEKRLRLYGNMYHIDLDFNIGYPDKYLLNNEYQIGLINGLPSNEENISEEFTYSESYASMGEELESFEIDDEGDVEPVTFIGKTDWIAVRTKYFLSAIIPREANTAGVNFKGRGIKRQEIVERRYHTQLIVSKANATGKADAYTLYLGPLDYSILSDYEVDLDRLVLNHGWYERTFRAISLPIVSLLKFFYIFIPNYGIVIIIFSILVKIVVYPLTKKSYKSMKEMGKVQPLIAELREKYKGDPQRLNKETMKLYKEHSINPLGGCLPMLLQLPLLGALFIVFRSTIQLRGATFIPGWIDDLSRADTIFTLPFSLPMYGDQFNILPILMAGSMIFQSKMTMQDPKQKAMVYLMPIFMLLIFNQFPSGLNLYYTLFNVLTIIQQKFTDNSPVKPKNGLPKKQKK